MEIAGGNGDVARLPPGFRFHPTDEELVTQYLRRKTFGLPLPVNIISDADLARHNNPWDLPGWREGEKEMFFFSPAIHGGGDRTRRASAASCGYWRASGRDKPVFFSGRDRLLVGMKKTMVFYLGKPARALRTKWVLHEYRLAGAGAAAARVNPSHGLAASPAERWVVCRIFRERSAKKARKSAGADENSSSSTTTTSSSSSSSSCVTGIPEEESSMSTDDEASSRSPAAAAAAGK